jgi:hypothetical protein
MSLNVTTVLYRVTFTQPFTGGNSVAIIAYEVQIQTKNGTWLIPQGCQSNAALVANRWCEITLTTLITDFQLVQGDLIISRVRSLNEIGWSLYSNVSSQNVSLCNVPQPPVNLPIRVSSGSTLTSIYIRLPEITGAFAGGLTILSYSIQRSRDQINW